METVTEPIAPAESATAPVSTNPLFQEPASKPKRYHEPTHVASLVLGILSIIFSLLIALVGDILGIIGICTAVSRRSEYNVTAGLTCSIIGLCLSIMSHVLAIIMMVSA